MPVIATRSPADVDRAEDDAEQRHVIDDGARRRDLERRGCGVAREFRGDRFAQRRQAPADGDLDTLAAIDEVRENAAAQRFAVEPRNGVLRDIAREPAPASAARAWRATRIDRDRENRESAARSAGRDAQPATSPGRPRKTHARTSVPRSSRGDGRGRTFRASRRRRAARSVGAARRQQRAELRDEPGIAAEQEAERLARVGVHRARVDALAHQRERRRPLRASRPWNTAVNGRRASLSGSSV